MSSDEQFQQRVADGVADGLQRVLSDPKNIAMVMDTVVQVAQQRAAEQTGRAFLGLAKSLLSKWLVIAAIVLLAAKVAGVDVATKVWRMLTGGSP